MKPSDFRIDYFSKLVNMFLYLLVFVINIVIISYGIRNYDLKYLALVVNLWAFVYSLQRFSVKNMILKNRIIVNERPILFSKSPPQTPEETRELINILKEEQADLEAELKKRKGEDKSE